MVQLVVRLRNYALWGKYNWFFIRQNIKKGNDDYDKS